MLRYTYHARNEDENTVRDYIDCEVEKLNDENVRRLAMTVAEQIRQRGKIEGLGEGRAVLIQKQLSKRFGFIPPLLEQKLRYSNLDLLDKFGESIFDFNNLRDAEKWWETHGTEH